MNSLYWLRRGTVSFFARNPANIWGIQNVHQTPLLGLNNVEEHINILFVNVRVIV